MRILLASASYLLAWSFMLAIKSDFALADLGGADITDKSGRNATGESYSARCGIKAVKCTVALREGRLVVDDGAGILSSQVVNVVTGRTCRQTSIIMPWVKSCYASQYDHDFTISYKATDGTEKSALIAFRPGYFHQGEEAYESFNRDLQIWMRQVLRPIGPSMEIEIKPAQ